MTAIKLKNSHGIKAAPGQVVDPAKLKLVCPAIFNTKPGPCMMDKYTPISTMDVIEALLADGYSISEAAQQGGTKWTAPFQKHMVRMRLNSLFGEEAKVGEVVPEIIVVNSHDGSSKLHLLAGLFRLVCTNGLMVGNTIAARSLLHTAPNRGAILGQVNDFVEKGLPTVQADINRLRARDMSVEDRGMLSAAAINLRWGQGYQGVTTDLLLRIRRNADAGNDAWTILNRIQENVINGGFPSATSKRVVAPLESVPARIHVNRGLWDAAMALV